MYTYKKHSNNNNNNKNRTTRFKRKKMTRKTCNCTMKLQLLGFSLHCLRVCYGVTACRKINKI